MSLDRLRPLGLVRGEQPLPPSLVQACDEGRLLGGLSLSERATPDEVITPLLHAMGGPASAVRVLDVLKGPPPALEVSLRHHSERWSAASTAELIDVLNERFLEDEVRSLVVLGSWEGMLQVWPLHPAVLEGLMGTSLFAEAWNRRWLEEQFGDEWSAT